MILTAGLIVGGVSLIEDEDEHPGFRDPSSPPPLPRKMVFRRLGGKGSSSPSIEGDNGTAGGSKLRNSQKVEFGRSLPAPLRFGAHARSLPRGLATVHADVRRDSQPAHSSRAAGSLLEEPLPLFTNKPTPPTPAFDPVSLEAQAAWRPLGAASAGQQALQDISPPQA
jgi:hypothetical protein